MSYLIAKRAGISNFDGADVSTAIVAGGAHMLRLLRSFRRSIICAMKDDSGGSQTSEDIKVSAVHTPCAQDNSPV